MSESGDKLSGKLVIGSPISKISVEVSKKEDEGWIEEGQEGSISDMSEEGRGGSDKPKEEKSVTDSWLETLKRSPSEETWHSLLLHLVLLSGFVAS